MNRTQKSGIGFVADVREQSARPHGSDLFHDVEPEDLIKYGLIPEFVGRLPVVATLDELDEAALVQILTEPRNALTKQYRKLFDMEGVEIEFREEALRAVARRAMQRKTGARGLRTILENVLLDIMYDLPGMRNVQKVVIDEDVIAGETQALPGLRRRGDAARGGRGATDRIGPLTAGNSGRHLAPRSGRRRPGQGRVPRTRNFSLESRPRVPKDGRI